MPPRKRTWLMFIPFQGGKLRVLAAQLDRNLAENGVWRSGELYGISPSRASQLFPDSDDFEPQQRQWYIYKKGSMMPYLAIPLSSIPGGRIPPLTPRMRELCVMFVDDLTKREETLYITPMNMGWTHRDMSGLDSKDWTFGI